MSDSPKWTSVRVSPEVRRQLREERRRRREQQRVRRAAERERRSQERFRSAQSGLCCSLDQIEGEVQQFQASPLAPFASQDGLNNQQNALQRCRSQVELAADEGQLKPILSELRRLRKQLSRLVSDAESQQFAKRLQQEELVLRRLKQRLQSTGSEISVKFDPDGLIEVDRLFEKVRQGIQRGSLDEARELLRQTAGRITEHEAVVEKRMVRWEQRKQKAMKSLSSIEDVISGVKTDEAVMRWKSAEILRLEQQLTIIDSELTLGRFAEVERRCGEIGQTLKQLEQESQQEQGREDQRRYIVDSMCSAMQKFGFDIESVQPAQEADPHSDTIIYARRPSGREIGISVPQEGNVWYQLDGYPMHVHSGTADETTRSCDEGELEIEVIHELLQESFGIETGELMWRGKDPNRIGKQQKRLPESKKLGNEQTRHQ